MVLLATAVLDFSAAVLGVFVTVEEILDLLARVITDEAFATVEDVLDIFEVLGVFAVEAILNFLAGVSSFSTCFLLLDLGVFLAVAG